MTLTREHDDNSYRPAPIRLGPSERDAVSPELQTLLSRRERLRTDFLHLDGACDCWADTDKRTPQYRELNRHRDAALGALLDAEDAVLLFDPHSIADLRIVCGMARHQIEETQIHDEFLERLLAHVERLVLEAKAK